MKDEEMFYRYIEVRKENVLMADKDEDIYLILLCVF